MLGYSRAQPTLAQGGSKVTQPHRAMAQRGPDQQGTNAEEVLSWALGQLGEGLGTFFSYRRKPDWFTEKPHWLQWCPYWSALV